MRPLVLVVEDNEAVAEGLREVLEMSGYDVTHARDGESGLQALYHGPRPSLIILDVMLPGMDGLTFRRHQTENRRLARIPVIGWTAFSGLESDFPILVKGHTSTDTLLHHVGHATRKRISMRRLAIIAGLAGPAVALVKALLDWLRSRR